MDSLSVRAVLKVMEPPMALRVLVEGEDEGDEGEERQGDSFINLESETKVGEEEERKTFDARARARVHTSQSLRPRRRRTWRARRSLPRG